jgi:hypothetical protein
MGTIRGRVGGMIGGYSVECLVDADGIFGRLGGSLIGADINLKRDPEGRFLEGRIGGSIIGKDLKVEVGKDFAHARLGGSVVGNDITLSCAERITGRCGGGLLGFDINLSFDPDTGRLTGRLGGQFSGKDVDFEVADTPPVYGGIIAAVTYYFYRENRKMGRSFNSR